MCIYKYYYIFTIFCILLFTVTGFTFPQEEIQDETIQNSFNYSGQILNVDKPVDFATVVLLELSIDTFTDEEGNFFFEGVPEGTYTLLVIVDGFQDKEFPISITSDISGEKFQVEDVGAQEVYEEDIVIISERLKNSNGGELSFSRDYVDRMPMKGDDPISLFEHDTGVIQYSGASTFEIFPEVEKGQVYTHSKEFTVFGSESAWNRYFYGNIQIPTNNHIANPTTSVITRKVVRSVTIYKGAPFGIYGPGLGGTVVLQPRRDPDNYLLLGVSPTDPSVTFSFWFSESLSLFISVRHSIAKYTLIPLTTYLVDSFFDGAVLHTKDYSYGDAIVSLEYNKGIHNVSFQTLGFYDDWITDSNFTIPASGSRTSSDVQADINTLPLFGALGVNWGFLVGENSKNTIATSFSIHNSSANSGLAYDTTDDTFHLQYSYAGYSRIINYKLLNQYEWFLADTMSISFGAELQYLNMKGKHTDKYYYSSEKEQRFLDIESVLFEVSENIYKLYGFTEYIWTINKFETRSTVGLTQIIRESDGTSFDRSFPSAREEVAYNFNDKWRISLMASWNPTFIEGAKYMDRRLAERRSGYANESQYVDPTYGITTVPKLTWQINDVNVVYLSGFYAYYYNFTGMTSGIVIDHDRESPTGYKYLTPEGGIGTGGSIEWDWTPKYHICTISYTLSYAMYNVEEYGWIPPETDYRHQLKMSYAYSKIKQFKFGITGHLLFDTAFTPREIITIPYNQTTMDGRRLLVRVEQNMHPYSARSYIPKYDLYVNLQGIIVDRKKWDIKYRFQTSNLLSMFVLRGNGLRDESIGANNRDVDNRIFESRIEPVYLLQNIYLTFEVAIDLPRL